MADLRKRALSAVLCPTTCYATGALQPMAQYKRLTPLLFGLKKVQHYGGLKAPQGEQFYCCVKQIMTLSFTFFGRGPDLFLWVPVNNI